jgi:tape measure domain-containing protein
LRGARGELTALAATGARTERAMVAGADRMVAGWRNLARTAGAAFGVIGAAMGAGAVFRGAAEVQGITNGFLGMGQSASQAAASLADVAAIAERTRAPLGATAELYRRVSVAAGELGASQAEISRFTENVGLALASSGIGAQQASGALLQLSQAMAGGIVRAEEFNSILEGAFPIAQANTARTTSPWTSVRRRSRPLW